MSQTTLRPRLLSTQPDQGGKRRPSGQVYPYRPDGSRPTPREMLEYLHRKSSQLWKTELQLRHEQHETASILKRVKAERTRTLRSIERLERELEQERSRVCS
jgi:hypothetical protein